MSLALIEPDGVTVRQRWQRTSLPSLRLPENYAGSIASGSLAEVARSGRPRIIDDLELHHGTHPRSESTALMLSAGIRSSFTCPVAHRKKPIGFLFFSSTTPGTYRRVHVETFLRIASSVSSAIAATAAPRPPRRGGLGALLAGLARTLDRAHQERTLIAGISSQLSAGVPLTTVLDHVYGAFSAVIPYDRMGLALIDDDETVRLTWARTRATRLCLAPGYGEPLVWTSLGTMLEHRAPRILNDLTVYLHNHPTSSSTALLVQEGMRSSLTCPIYRDDQPLGFLFFSSFVAGAYRRDHAPTYEQIAERIGAAVAKAVAFGEQADAQRAAEALLTQMMPAEVVQRLRQAGGPFADELDEVGVLFADIVGFTDWSRDLAAAQLIAQLDALFGDFDILARKHGVLKIRNIGDGYLAVSGTLDPTPGHLDRLADFGLAMVTRARQVRRPDGAPLELRVGISCGPVVAGVIGRSTFQYDVWGSTVNLASRLEASGSAGRVLVTEWAAARLEREFLTRSMGMVALRGFGPRQVYQVLRRRA